MAPEDAAAFAALPETLSLHRGQDDLTRLALSWRLSEGAGEGRCKEDFFIEAKAPKAAVAGLYTMKAKTEIVLFSCRDVAALR
jgi:hypothetical protein